MACAWFALGVHQAQDTNRASALVGGPGRLSRVEAARARSLLSSAATLNPDRTPTILRGQLDSEQGAHGAAVRTLESVTRNEPMNLQAWVQLAYAAARDGDRRALVVAARHISALFPKLK